FVNKVAIPFSVINTGLHGWDLYRETQRVKDSKDILAQASRDKTISPDELKKLDFQIEAYKTNTKIKAFGLAVSAISTSALIHSVARPATAKYTLPVALAGGAIASISRTAANEKLRTMVKIHYHLGQQQLANLADKRD